MALLASSLSVALLFISSCGTPTSKGLNLNIDALPEIVLWAWERNEDLRFINTKKVAIAYYAGTIYLKGDYAFLHPRMNPLRLSESAVRFPVFRIENADANNAIPERGSLKRASELVSEYVTRHNAPVVQIDYDARLNERASYLSFLKLLRSQLPTRTSLSVTALLSWCLADKWLSKAPVDEAVAMAFSLGDGKTTLSRDLKGNVLNAGVSRQSLGACVDEKETNQVLRTTGVTPFSRRLYLFSSKPWSQKRLSKCLEDL